MPRRPATIRLSRIGSASSATHRDAGGHRGQHVRRARAARARAARGSTAAPRTRATTRPESRCRRRIRPRWSPARRSTAQRPPPRKYRRGACGSSPCASNLRIAAANAWSVSRNASAPRQRGGSGLQVRRHRRAVHQEAQAQHERGQHDDRDRRAGRQHLRSEDLRGAGEDDRAHADRASQSAPAAAAPTPHTRPNGISPMQTGSISTNPARKSGDARIRRMEWKGEVRDLPS